MLICGEKVTENRDQTLDACKGILILMVVAGHVGMPFSSFYTRFHMIVFFLVAGLTYHYRHHETLQNYYEFIRKKLVRLWIPYVLVNSIVILCNNLFMMLHIYTENPIVKDYAPMTTLHHIAGIGETLKNIVKVLLFSGVTDLGGVTWFLRALFISLVVFAGILYLFRKVKWKGKTVLIIQGGVFGAFLTAAYFISAFDIRFGTHELTLIKYIFIVTPLLYIGDMMKRFFSKGCSKRSMAILCSCSFLLLCLLMVLPWEWNMPAGTVGTPISFILTAISGLMFVFFLSAMCLEFLPVLGRALLYFGKRSFPIMLMHFLVFKVVNYFTVAYHHWPDDVIASFPLPGNIGIVERIVYFVSGVVVPCLLSETFERIKNKKMTGA